MLLNLAACEMEQTDREKSLRGSIWQMLNLDNYHDPSGDKPGEELWYQRKNP
jgi:hypothetical protein